MQSIITKDSEKNINKIFENKKKTIPSTTSPRLKTLPANWYNSKSKWQWGKDKKVN